MTDPRTYQANDGLLKDRVILITGASDGIGKALALRCAELEAQVLLHGRNVRKLEAVYDAIEAIAQAPRPSIVAMDLEKAESAAYTSLADGIADEFGRLDGLVHNAGILGERFPLEQYDIVMWQKVMHVNVTAAFALTQVLLPLLRKSDDASVIFTSSGVGRVGKAHWGAYAVSKFATEGLSQILADEHSHTTLRSNCINPGPVKTKMRQAAYPAEDQDKLKSPEEILSVYLYLLGSDSAGTTGQSIDAQ